MVGNQPGSSPQGRFRATEPLGTPYDLRVLNPINACWKQVGPQPFFGLNPVTGKPDEAMSGQVSAIAVDLAHDPSGNLVYVGSSSGGLWRSTNGLDRHPHFELLSDETQSLSVGSIALDTRTDPPIIYVGTGAPDNSANISSYTGIGILISGDGGRTWKRVESADRGAHPFTGLGFSSILLDPVQPNILLASTGFGTDPNYPHSSIPQGDLAFNHLGIYRSEDSGDTWTQVMTATYDDPDFNAHLLSPGGFFHIDLLYEPRQGNYWAGVSKQGLFLSTDRGRNWFNVKSRRGWGMGLPDDGQMHRISLATRGGLLWAILLKKPFASSNAFELYYSDDGGQSWNTQPLPPDPSPFGLFKGALMYVAAPPESNILVFATDGLHRRDDFTDPNSHWVDISQNVHGDQHAIAFASADTWYVGDDGGAWATLNHGVSWNSLNEDLHTCEFFSAAASADGGALAGGTQDNGPALTAGDPAWQQLVIGDGAYVAGDPQDAGVFFVSRQYGDIFYSRMSTAGNPQSVIQLANLNPVLDFLAPFELLPTDSRLYQGAGFQGFDFASSRILLMGANNPWLVAFNPEVSDRNTVAVELTSAVNSIIHYVAPVPSDPTTAYLVAGSALYRLSNISFAGNATLKQIRQAGDGPLNGDVLGHLAVSASGILYLTKVGFCDGEKIYRSADGGTTWTNISNNLPNTPLHWVTVDPVHPEFIFVGCDTGVYVATDGGVLGEEWRRLGRGLPNVPVMQTRISQDRKLIAATFGRGVWALDISNLIGVTGDPVLIQSSWGNKGNFELLVPQEEMIKHFVRINDEPTLSWYYVREFGYPTLPTQLGPSPRAVTFIQSNYLGDGVHGNFEAIVRVSPALGLEPDLLDFWYFDSGKMMWNGPYALVADGQAVTGVTGDPVLIKSTWGQKGNFQLLVPQGNVIRHYYRNNDDPMLPWHLLGEFGYGEVEPTPLGVTFIQGNYLGDGAHGNFEAVVRHSAYKTVNLPDGLDFWYFDSAASKWNGPSPLVADGQVVTGVTGNPVLIQSSWGKQGNFELLVPQGEVIKHYVRDNDDPKLSWHYLRDFGYPTTPPTQLGPTPRGVTFIQGNYLGDDVHGNFEAVVRVSAPLGSEPDALHFWYFDTGQMIWQGPLPLC